MRSTHNMAQAGNVAKTMLKDIRTAASTKELPLTNVMTIDEANNDEWLRFNYIEAGVWFLLLVFLFVYVYLIGMSFAATLFALTIIARLTMIYVQVSSVKEHAKNKLAKKKAALKKRQLKKKMKEDRE